MLKDDASDNPISRRWARYPITYRNQEMQTIARWIVNGDSGSVVGLPGVGRSTLLGFLYHRPDALATYLTTASQSVTIIPVDLNILPDYSVATLYRVILRSFYQARHQFPEPLQQIITTRYPKNEAARDPFLPQSALLEILTSSEQRETRIVWLLNRFDEFCEAATPEMIRTLRGLRDSFKETLCYIVGMLREVAYLSDPVLVEPLHDILDVNVCWVGPLNETDARDMILRELRATAIEETDIGWIAQLTGGHPMLIRITCHWLLSTPVKPPQAQWLEILLAQRKVKRRLERIWNGLTQEEQFTVSELQKIQSWPPERQKEKQRIVKQHQDTLIQLQKKGICHPAKDEWRTFGTLFANYVAQVEGRGRGRVWLDKNTDELYQGQTLVESLTHLERAALHFFVKHPRVRHAHSDIIEAVWPEDVQKEGVSTETLYQTIRGVRKKIEPNPSKPVYVINWRGQPEGGYQFFSEGLPGR